MTLRDAVKPLIKMLLSALAAILAVLYAIGTFGWFSSAHRVTSNGTDVYTKDVSVLEIRATAAGNDISVSVEENDMERLPFHAGGSTTLHPTSYGSFSFFVNESSSQAQIPYSFLYKVTAENNRFREDEGFDRNTDAAEREQALIYINSHLLFFLDYDADTGLYSNWIRSGELIRCTANQNPQKVTVYWVWVDQYKQVFEENSGLIEEETRKEIEAYYADKAEMMLADGTSPAEAYNVADTLIGMTIKYVCFRVDVTKD